MKRLLSLEMISCFSIVMGISCLVAKGLTIDYTDENGVLHEMFFLLPIGYSLLFIGIILYIIFKILHRKKTKKVKHDKNN